MFRIVMLTLDQQIDRRILLQADSLRTAGWEVILISIGEQRKEDSEIPYLHRIVNKDVKSISKTKLNLVNFAKWVRRNVAIPTFAIKMARAILWKFFVNPTHFYKKTFEGVVFQFPADVYVAHDLPVLSVAHQAAKNNAAKLVYDAHELYSEQSFLSSWESRMWLKIESQYIPDCDQILTVNQSIADELHKRHPVSVNRIGVIENAELLPSANIPHTNYFHELYQLPENTLIALYQGNIIQGRNLDVMIKSLTLLNNQQVHLVLLGNGPLVSKLKTIVKKNNMLGCVHFHPAVSQKKLLLLTAAADVGIIPYQPICLNTKFCTPNKLYEFIIAGLPIVGTDLPELRKIIIGNEMGVVGDTSTPASFAELLAQFFSNKERINQYKSAVAKARLQINWQREEFELLKQFDFLVEKQKSCVV